MQPALLPSVIAVGVDGSPESGRALIWALSLAHALRSRLVVVHSTGLLEGAGLQPAVDLDQELDAARQTLASATPNAEVASDNPKQPAVELVRRPGHPVDVLLSEASERGAELLVVGRRGSGLKPAGLGSTSEGILQGASVPVVVVPHDG